MSTRSTLSLCLSLAALSLAACNGALPLGARPPASVQASAALRALRGSMEVPTLFKTLATSNEVAAYAGVVLRDSAGLPVATGTTDNTGHFTLKDLKTGVTFTEGTTFTLEAVKRIDGALLSLRTVVKRESGDWRSITGNVVKLNIATSTLTKLYESQGLDADDVLDRVDVSTGDFTGAVGSTSLADLNVLKGSLTVALADGFNPSGRLGKGQVLLIQSQADLDRVISYSEIEGIFVVSDDLTTLRFPNLKRFGTMIIGSSSITTVDFPALEEAGSIDVWSLASDATSWSWPKLKSWNGGHFNNLGGIEALRVPTDTVYREIPGALNKLDLSGSPSLAVLTLPPNSLPPSITINNLDNLESLGETPWRGASIQEFRAWRCPKLTNLDVLSEVSTLYRLELSDLGALTQLNLSHLTNVDSASLYGLPQLVLSQASNPWYASVGSLDTDHSYTTAP